jgi:hypothetical protein
MEVLATISTISSIVQLVDFSSKCVSKGIQLHQSGSEALDDNVAVEAALVHLVSLKNEVQSSATATSDVLLDQLCQSVTEAASDLQAVLETLKVHGTKSRWKTMRKAI